MENNKFALVSYDRGHWYHFRKSDTIHDYSCSFWLSFLPDGSCAFTGDWEPIIWKRNCNFQIRPTKNTMDIFPRSGSDFGYWKSKVRANGVSGSQERWQMLFEMIMEGMDHIAEFEDKN